MSNWKPLPPRDDAADAFGADYARDWVADAQALAAQDRADADALQAALEAAEEAADAELPGGVWRRS